jgi:hypothetical protein
VFFFPAGTLPNKSQHLSKPKRTKRQLALPFIMQTRRGRGSCDLCAHPGQRNIGQGAPTTPIRFAPPPGVLGCRSEEEEEKQAPEAAREKNAGPRKRSVTIH